MTSHGMSRNDVLDSEADGLKGNDQGKSFFILSGGRIASAFFVLLFLYYLFSVISWKLRSNRFNNLNS